MCLGADPSAAPEPTEGLGFRRLAKRSFLTPRNRFAGTPPQGEAIATDSTSNALGLIDGMEAERRGPNTTSRSPSSSPSAPRSEPCSPCSPRPPRPSARSPRCARSPGAQRRTRSCPGARPLQPSHALCSLTNQAAGCVARLQTSCSKRSHSPPSCESQASAHFRIYRSPSFPGFPPGGGLPFMPASHSPPSCESSRSLSGPVRSRDRRPPAVRPPRSLAYSSSRYGLTNETGEVCGVLLFNSDP